MRLLVLGLAMLLGTGCAAMQKPKPGTPAWDAMATRSYPVAPERVLAAAAQVFTDLGIEIAQSDSGLGLMKGTRKGYAGVPLTYQLLVSKSDAGSKATLRISGDYAGSSKVKDWPEDYAAIFDLLSAALTSQ